MDIIQALISQGYTKEEAENLFDSWQDQILDGCSIFDMEDELYAHGLEPDYLEDLLF